LGAARRRRRITWSLAAAVFLAIVTVAIALPTTQDFDNPGTPFIGQNFPAPNAAPAPAVMGPDGFSGGQFLRIQQRTSRRTINTVGFDQTDTGVFNRIVVDFDFRITCAGARIGFSLGGCADGFSIVLLDTSIHGTSGAPRMERSLPEHGGVNPDLSGQFGFGFNTFNNFGFAPDANSSNSLSMIWQNAFVTGSFINLDPLGFDLATGTFGNHGPFHHAHIELVLGGSPNVTMTLTHGVSGNEITPFSSFDLSTFVGGGGKLVTPFESRVGFGVRCGDACADYDLDNIHVQYLDPVVDNQPPVADAGVDQTIECAGAGGALVTLDGSASFDPDFDPLTYTWTGPFSEGGGVVSGATPAITLPPGVHTITLTVMDAFGETAQDDVVIRVEQDTTAPSIDAISVSPDELWPANHQMVDVEVSVDVSDMCDTAISAAQCTIVSVTSNEPVNGTGDGDTSPDWVITGSLTAQLRAERAGGGAGAGRVYTITVECTDAGGNVATATTTVTVPQNKGKK
jgi:hypothetical protein